MVQQFGLATDMTDEIKKTKESRKEGICRNKDRHHIFYLLKSFFLLYYQGTLY
jgi:hypothetical protein